MRRLGPRPPVGAPEAGLAGALPFPGKIGKDEASFDEANGVLSAPRDAIEACGVIAGAIKMGALPADAEERHGLTMFDVGAAFAGETVVVASVVIKHTIAHFHFY